MRVPDSAMPAYYELLLDEPFDPEAPAVESKRRMAGALTARLHGDEAAREAEAHFDRLHVTREAPDEIEELAVAVRGRRGPPAGRAARRVRRSRSSEARRLLAQGGVKLDGEPLSGEDLDVPAGRLDGAVLQVGKRRFRRLRVT